MKVYIDGDKHYEDEAKIILLDDDLAARMIQSGCQIFVMGKKGWVEKHNKYKFIDMINIVVHLLNQCKGTLVVGENPLMICKDIKKKLIQMTKEMPKGKNGFKL